MPDFVRKMNANGCRCSTVPNAFTGRPRLRAFTSTATDATLPNGTPPPATIWIGSMLGPPGWILRSMPASLKYPLPIAVKSPAICALASQPSCSDSPVIPCACTGDARPSSRPPAAPRPSTAPPAKRSRRLTGRVRSVIKSRFMRPPLSIRLSDLRGLGHRDQIVRHDLVRLHRTWHLFERDIGVAQFSPDLRIHVAPPVLLGGDGREVVAHVTERGHLERPVEARRAAQNDVDSLLRMIAGIDPASGARR